MDPGRRREESVQEQDIQICGKKSRARKSTLTATSFYIRKTRIFRLLLRFETSFTRLYAKFRKR
jgi:hypothetical protein